MSSFDSTPTPSMVDCPKCGFQQPADQYCAKCGVDMLKLRKNAAAMLMAVLKKPATISVLAICAVAFTVGGLRALKHKPNQSVNSFAQETRTHDLRANVSDSASNNFSNTKSKSANEEARPTVGSTVSSTGADVPQDLNAVSSTSSQVQIHEPAAPTTTASPSSIGSQIAGAGKTAEAGKATDAGDGPALQVTFAWAEASRDWLQAMGATTPGLHRVADLDSKLRASVGGYRILEVTRRKLNDKPSVSTLIHGDRLSVRFESTTANDSTLVGSIQPAMRAVDGSVRSPAAAAVSIEKGQGSIVTLDSGAAPAGANPTGAEIILLILPRWGADRNP